MTAPIPMAVIGGNYNAGFFESCNSLGGRLILHQRVSRFQTLTKDEPKKPKGLGTRRRRGLRCNGVASEMHYSRCIINVNSEMIFHDSNSFRKGRETERAYDIFKRRDNDYPYWITAAASLEEARKRITGYALIVAGEYFVYSQGEGIILECITPEKEEPRTTRPIWLWPHSWSHMQHGKVA